ncbi:hypothetical protein BDW62DRAFT_191437 [Aspergillus aurantiobrunneus]
MLRNFWRLAVVAATLAGRSQAQDLGNQTNTTICNWGQLRANTIRDTVYLDGGELWWQLGFSSGDTMPRNDDNSEGLVYYLNLSSSFNSQTTNFYDLLGNFSKAGGIAGNLAPTYEDGVMFANDNQFYLYGGHLSATDTLDDPPDDSILLYGAHPYGSSIGDWSPGFVSSTLDDGTTRYITNGAGVSAPSENLGFYISGMRAPDWGPIWDNDTATELSQRMITIDMSVMNRPEFSNASIPNYVPPRANAEAVWIPVGGSGIVALIGGVITPESLFATGLSDEDQAASERASPAFMETVSVYDVAQDVWYIQNTTGEIPPQLTQFCSVYASAADGSSHNIYIYGGYDGLDPYNDPSDDVYVLSLPSFEWIHLYSGDSDGRKQHKCVKPYPDQMLVLGGTNIGSSRCLDFIRVFNLNTGRFQDAYNPAAWAEYEVPDLVSGRIGGGANGGATTTSPESGWINSSLGDVFSTAYTTEISTWYPYNSTTTTTVETSGGGGGFPGWGGAIIGVVLGLLIIALIVWWFLRRRKRGSRRHSEVSRGSRVMQWVNAGAFGPASKDPENSTIVSGGLTNESTVTPSEPRAVVQTTAEAAGDPVYEMQGHSTASNAVELPTPYNEHSLPNASPTATGFASPVSPEIPQEKEGDTSRPGHQRNASSLSSMSFSPGYTEGSVSPRPQYVSGVSEASVSSAGTRPGETGFNRGLGLEDIPDTEREGDR